MKVLVLIIAIAAGFSLQQEGCLAERIAWQAVQVGQMEGGKEI